LPTPLPILESPMRSAEYSPDFSDTFTIKGRQRATGLFDFFAWCSGRIGLKPDDVKHCYHGGIVYVA
jgi:hypothetical protein